MDGSREFSSVFGIRNLESLIWPAVRDIIFSHSGLDYFLLLYCGSGLAPAVFCLLNSDRICDALTTIFCCRSTATIFFWWTVFTASLIDFYYFTAGRFKSCWLLFLLAVELISIILLWVAFGYSANFCFEYSWFLFFCCWSGWLLLFSLARAEMYTLFG